MLCDNVWSARDAGEGEESIKTFVFKQGSWLKHVNDDGAIGLIQSKVSAQTVSVRKG